MVCPICILKYQCRVMTIKLWGLLKLIQSLHNILKCRLMHYRLGISKHLSLSLSLDCIMLMGYSSPNTTMYWEKPTVKPHASIGGVDFCFGLVSLLGHFCNALQKRYFTSQFVMETWLWTQNYRWRGDKSDSLLRGRLMQSTPSEQTSRYSSWLQKKTSSKNSKKF